jgi:hypothetical protein
MNRLYVLGFATALLVLVPGCGSNDPDSLMKKRISLSNDLASVIEKKESTDKIKAIVEKIKANEDKFASIKMSADDSKKLMEKYQKELVEAGMKAFKAAIANPEGMNEAMKELASGSGFSGDGTTTINGFSFGDDTTTTTTNNGSSTTPTRAGGGSFGKKK